jgi:hypothetical protein
MNKQLLLSCVFLAGCSGWDDGPGYVVANTAIGGRGVYREVFLTGAFRSGVAFVDAAEYPAGTPLLGWSSNLSWGLDADLYPPPVGPPGVPPPDDGYARYWRAVGSGGRHTDVAVGFGGGSGQPQAELQLVRGRTVTGPVPPITRFFCQDYLAVSTCMPWNDALRFRHVTCFSESAVPLEPGDCLGWFPRNHWLLVDADNPAAPGGAWATSEAGPAD